MNLVLDGAVLVYILAESGVRGRLTSGRIERGTNGTLNVFDSRGNRFEYLSGHRFRSWCVLDGAGNPVDGWGEILPGDLPKLTPQSIDGR